MRLPTSPPAPREGLWLGLALALAASLPFLVAAYPMMTDYPSHLARYHVMLDQGHSAWLARYYSFEWRWSGNLGADLLIRPLAALLGLEPAAKLIAAIVPPLTGLALMTVEWTLRRRIGPGALLAFATIWSPAMGMGLINFCLAFALALFAFALWVRLEHWPWRWLVFLPIGLIVWLCHLAGWGVLGVLVGCHELQRRRPGLSAFGKALIAPWPLTLPLVPLLLAGGATGLTDYGKNLYTYKTTIWFMALRDRSMTLDILTVTLIVLAFAAAAVARKLDGRLAWAALAFAALSLALPRHLGGGDYSDYRLTAVALTIAALAISWNAPRWALWLAPVLFLIRLGETTTAWHASSRELETILGALDHMPRGARVAAAIPVQVHAWPLNPFEHAHSYATVRRDALVNSHFAQPGVHMLHLREGGPGFIDPSQRILRYGEEPIDLAQFPPAAHADYLWYIGHVPPSRIPAGAVVLYRTEHSFLARLAPVRRSR